MRGRKPAGTPKKKWNTRPEGKICYYDGCRREAQFYCKDSCMKWMCYLHSHFSSIREINLCEDCYQRDIAKMKELLLEEGHQT